MTITPHNPTRARIAAEWQGQPDARAVTEKVRRQQAEAAKLKRQITRAITAVLAGLIAVNVVMWTGVVLKAIGVL